MSEGGAGGGLGIGITQIVDALKGSARDPRSSDWEIAAGARARSDARRAAQTTFHTIADPGTFVFEGTADTRGGVGQSAGINPWLTARALPGTPGAPTPPPSPPGAEPYTWRDAAEDAGKLIIQLWQQHYDAQQQKRLARYFDQIRRAAINRVGGVIPQPSVRAGAGSSRMPDLLQFSGTGGTGSLFGRGYESAGGGLGWADALLGIGGGVINYLTQRQQGDLAPYGDPWGPDILYPTADRANDAINRSIAGGCGSPWIAGANTLRSSTFAMANPSSGKLTWFKPAGRPVLWSGDFSAARRVQRVASKAKRRCRSGGR